MKAKLYLPGILSIGGILTFLLLSSCHHQKNNSAEVKSNGNDSDATIYDPSASDLKISRSEYQGKLYGFWLGQCIANWTGLVTEMDKVGNTGEPKTGEFYTRENWGKPDQPSIWGEGLPSDISPTIDFVFADTSEIWGADDDTDIEYMYQYLLYTNQVSVLSGEQSTGI